MVPSCKTLNDLLAEYLALHRDTDWAPHTYADYEALINNYIRPTLGPKKLSDITTHTIDRFYKSLYQTSSVKKYSALDQVMVTPATIDAIHKLLRACFNQAKKWKMITENPVVDANHPKVERKAREIWDAETFFRFLGHAKEPLLVLAATLSFVDTLRIGEILGLTWDNVHISDDLYARKECFIRVDKQLDRVKKELLGRSNASKIYYVFPSSPESVTALVLKAPKTQASVRKVFLPNEIVPMLKSWKQEQERMKELLSSEYHDHNLVLANQNGAPCEESKIRKELNKIIEEAGLPKVVFHSFRHTSISLKLQLNGGDIKAVQGDAGHSSTNMVANVYAHTFEKNRIENAALMGKAYFGDSVQPVGNGKPTMQEWLEDCPDEKMKNMVNAIMEMQKGA